MSEFDIWWELKIKEHEMLRLFEGDDLKALAREAWEAGYAKASEHEGN